jgi:outer membrane biosynthesis protein TonB
MANNFDNERRRKAFIYTAAICSLFLIAFIFINWKVSAPAPPVVQQMIEINLGNDDEGLGEVQPLIKGETSPDEAAPAAPEQEPAAAEPETQAPAPVQDIPADDKITPDENAEKDAAPVARPVTKPTPKKATPTPTPVTKTVTKPTPNPTPVITPTPKPKIAKSTYKGPGSGGGNGADKDNGYKYEGNKPDGTGDKGVPSGNKDTYGNNKGGSTVGGPRVISGNRKLIPKVYNFSGDLKKAKINAIIRVSANGVGTFIRIDANGSTNTGADYANAIRGYLNQMPFDKKEEESMVTVQFNFTEN